VSVTVYRNTDTSAPVLSGQSGALTALLKACLVDGYGSKSPAGWTSPYSANGGNQRVFQGGSGVKHYFHVDDNAGGAGGAKEASLTGSETASAFQTGTGFFPTSTQLSTFLIARKSTTADATARAWAVIADDRTCYCLMQSGDTTGLYMCIAFGEFYSRLNPGPDSYRSFCIGRTTANSGAITTGVDTSALVTSLSNTSLGHYAARAYNGTGTSIAFAKIIDGGYIVGASAMGTSALSGADPCTGTVKVCPVRIGETAVNNAMRGRLRGLFSHLHANTTFGDQDTIVGSGAYTGRTFLVFSKIAGNGGSTGSWVFDITGSWDTN
jgi:hypothetical protein